MKSLMVLVAAAALAQSIFAATPEQLFTAGKQAMAQRDYDKAADLFEQASKAKPDSSEIHFWLGQAYGSQAETASIFRQPGLASRTHAEFARAVELDPNNNDARIGLIEFYLEAPAFMGGSDEKAAEQAQAIRKRDALVGHTAFARIYSHEKKPELVRKEYEDAVREQPNSPKAHYLLATYFMSQKSWKEALDELHTVTRLDAAFMPAWFRLGQLAVLADMKDLASGEESLKKYLGHKPGEDDPPVFRAWYWLGRIYERQGRKADAKQSYVASLKLNPGQKDVSEALKRVS